MDKKSKSECLLNMRWSIESGDINSVKAILQEGSVDWNQWIDVSL